MTRKRKISDELKESAEVIAEVVLPQPDRVVEKPSEAKKAPPPKPEPVIEVAKTSPVKNIRVKATETVKGKYGRMRYEIVACEVYTFPKEMAEWLIKSGRAF